MVETRKKSKKLGPSTGYISETVQ